MKMTFVTSNNETQTAFYDPLTVEFITGWPTRLVKLEIVYQLYYFQAIENNKHTEIILFIRIINIHE